MANDEQVAAHEPEHELEATDTPWRPNRTSVAIAALMSAGAGLVHAAAAGTHSSDRTLMILFSAMAVAQVGWAALAQARPTRGVLTLGVAVNGVAVAAWVLSRTTGLPWPESLQEVEAVGRQDLLAAVLGGLAVFGAMLAMRPVRDAAGTPARAATTPVVLAGVLALGLAFPGMVSQHSHGDDHAHGAGEGEAAAGHDHDEAAADDHGHDEAAGADHHDDAAHDDSPMISVDDERLTKAQRKAAKELISTTTAGMARFTDTASVEAAGYHSIGDSLTGYEHFINYENMRDGVEMDPNKIESIVFKVAPDRTKQLASAMYILSSGKTMADVPDIAGALTTWHDHQNLCWNDQGKVAGLLINGQCRPGGTFKATAPMLHVWMIPHECGPFAGIEGQHGGGCAHGEHGDEHAATGAGESAAGGGHEHAIPARLDHEPTKEQKADARKLITDTKAGVAGLTTTAAAEAAGYVSIGDSITGFEHFVNDAYLDNAAILDPSEIESLVFRVTPDGGRELATAMYLLPPGSTMEDVPDVAGNLTMWHDHKNLCWDPTGTKVWGVFRNGACMPRGELGVTSPMLHVWVTENKCGPFAGTDKGGMSGSCVEEF
ncbi:MAG TPA: hypothetical protein VJM33_14845 [Microthrixaceae bacterium]|nr:hypothetical protein [Microthrixaceae bacterium]